MLFRSAAGRVLAKPAAQLADRQGVEDGVPHANVQWFVAQRKAKVLDQIRRRIAAGVLLHCGGSSNDGPPVTGGPLGVYLGPGDFEAEFVD